MRIWSEFEEMGRGMNKTLPVCCQVVQTFPGLSIISSLLSCRCFSLDFQLSLLVARLPTDVWLPTPSHQLWLWWSRALLLWITALKFPLSCLFLCPPVTSAARGKLHVSHLPLCLSLFLKHTLSWPLCAPPPLCVGLYLVRGIKISSPEKIQWSAHVDSVCYL